MSLTEIKKVLKANGHPDRIEQLKIVAPGAKGAYGVRKYADGIDNWAVCDTLGMQSLKSINKIRTKEVFELANTLSDSKNMWHRRLSLVLVEDFNKRPELHAAILKLIKKQKSDKEYYIKRAVVWLESSMNKHT